MCTKRAGSTFLLDLLSQKKMLPKYKNIAIGAKATQFHLQRNGTWSIPHKSYPSSDIRPWLGLKYQLFLRPVCVRAPIVPSPRLSRSCWQRLYQLAFVKAPWAISFEICFANWSSLDIKYWDFIFLPTIQSSQDLKTFVLLISLSNLTNWVLNVRQEIVHDDR